MSNILNILFGQSMKKSSYKILDTSIKDTHREKAPSNKTPALKKSTNMDVRAVVTLNQLFIRGSYTETKLSKK